MTTIVQSTDVFGIKRLSIGGIPVGPFFGGTVPDDEPTLFDPRPQLVAVADSDDAGPFVSSATAWRAAGWLGTLPLPARRKNPPPSDFTGHGKPYPDDAQVERWTADRKRRRANIGLRLGRVDGDAENEIVGIDVDHYADDPTKPKFGGDQLRELERQLAPLPDTWISSARRDRQSGIRLYRVPAGLHWSGQAAKDIEIVCEGYRFAVVWPSIHPSGRQYTLYPPGAAPDGSSSWSGEIPRVVDLPMLPDVWIDHLTRGRTATTQAKLDTISTVDEVYVWADATFNDGTAAAMCEQVQKQVEHHVTTIRAESTSHDKIKAAHWNLYNLAAEGHTGWRAGVETVEDVYRRDVIERDKRSDDEVLGEIFRSKSRALRQIKAKVDQAASVGARYTPPDCTCTEVMKSRAVQGDSTLAPAAGEIGDRRRNAPLDLPSLRTEPPRPVVWIVPDVTTADSYVSLSAAPGTGKSILARAIAVEASIGRSAFNPTDTVEPAKVVYLDAENGEDWWRDGLNDMAVPMDLPNLKVVCFPELRGLDTLWGAAEFETLIGELAAEMGDEVDLVVLDTVSRFIEGGENDADTWSQFFRRAIQPLRNKKIAVLRLDHLGKDADRGPRGSSHKLSDVDADYRMTADKAGGNDLTLTLGKRRRQHFAQSVRLRRLDTPLRHEVSTGALVISMRNPSGALVPTDADADAAALVAELDQLNVATTLGRPAAQAAYKTAGGLTVARNEVWSAAVKFRKTRSAQSGQTP